MSAELFRNHIERALEPVRAAGSRKARMGEELSAHLTASFEEERARLGDDRAAAERAIRRLGEVDELSRSLQESVPRLERLLYTPLPAPRSFETWDRAWARRRDEPLPRYAARITVWLTAMITVGQLIGLLAASVVRTRPMDWPVLQVWAVANLAVYAAGTFVSPFLCDGLTRAILAGPSRRRRQVLYAVLSGLTVIVLGLGFVLIVSAWAPHGQIFRRSDGLRLLAMALLAPIILTVTAQSLIARRRRQDGWGLSDFSS